MRKGKKHSCGGALFINFRRIIKSYPLDLVDESVIADRVLP